MLRALACFVLSSCAAHQHGRAAIDDSPEAYLEQQLISNRTDDLNTPTADGGMLFHAEFSFENRFPLRMPFDVLRKHCEDERGHWVASGPPHMRAENLAASKAPHDVVDALADADSRDIFGTFRCESNAPTWTANIEPSALMPTNASEVWRLQLFVKAFVGSDLSQPGDPSGEPPPPTAATQSAPPAPPMPPTPSVVIPDAVATETKAASNDSPLDPRPEHAPLSSDKLLADPQPFGIDMGIDSPDLFGAKLRVDPAQSQCQKPSAAAKRQGGKKSAANSGTLSELCWTKPGGSEALELRAEFADFDTGSVAAEFELRYPAASFAWLERNMRNDWGMPDVSGDRPTSHSWSWLHTIIELSHENDDASHDTRVRVRHLPTLARARLPAGNPGRDQPGPTRSAAPWQLQLGFESAQQAQAKLQTAGFSIAANGCSDAGDHALPVLSRTCPLSGGKLDGLRSASAIIVDMGDGRPRLAKLEYTFDKRVLDAQLRELKSQYGNPIPVAGDAFQWWTGPVGIEVVPGHDSFQLRYFHGRLLQYHDNAVEKNAASARPGSH
jgi:hypothetical protein